MRRLFLLSLFAAPLVGSFACAATADALCDKGTCEASDGGRDVVGPPPGCDPNADAKDAPACVVDDYGIFVSPTGADGNAGTKAQPVRSIGRALALVVERSFNRVYVCDGVYEETVDVKVSANIFGGFACADWSANGSKPKIRPKNGAGVRLGAVSNVILADLDVLGTADPDVRGSSAIGVFAISSDPVTLRRVVVKSGPGTMGKDGAAGTAAPNYTDATAKSGGPALGSNGGHVDCAPCANGNLSKAGDGAAATGSADTGSATPTSPGWSDNSGATNATSCTAGTIGGNGAAGADPGKGGAAGGKLTADGWASDPSATGGATGRPGQGGGGGGAYKPSAFGGGGGGCGGCGGAGGTGAGNGGASFALVSFESHVRVEASSLESDAGGQGGTGGQGQPGQSGGGAGQAGGGNTCSGGPGGYGGSGAGGGGGAGGPSAAIAFTGTEPERDATTTLKPGGGGPPGSPGLGGRNPSGGNPGPNGQSGDPGSAESTMKF